MKSILKGPVSSQIVERLVPAYMLARSLLAQAPMTWLASISDRSLIEQIRQRLWGEREFGGAAVMVGSVHLVLPQALLRSPSMACRPRGPYQVLGEDWHGRG